MAERESLLRIGLDTVEACTHTIEETYSREYVRGMAHHMKRFQPELKRMISSEQKTDPLHNKTFRAGAFSTYDVIVSADANYWEKKKINKETIHTAKLNWGESIITSSKAAMFIYEDRVVTDMGWFYDKLMHDSPTFSEWLQLQAEQIEEPKIAREFIYGSLFTAMPFYLTREAEAFDERLMR